MNSARAKNRRKFLLTAGLGGAGVAAAIVGAGRGVNAADPAPSTGKRKGYQLSEHVQKYYKTTEV